MGNQEVISAHMLLTRRQDWDLGLVECGTAAGQSQSIPDVPHNHSNPQGLGVAEKATWGSPFPPLPFPLSASVLPLLKILLFTEFYLTLALL